MAISERLRRPLQLGLGVGLSAVFLYLAFRGEDWNDVGAQLREANYLYLAAMLPVGVYALYVRCQRWQILLERASGESCAMAPIFSATAIGFMANMLLPFRVGEFARPYLVSRHTTVSLTTALATVVIERVLDLIVLFAFAVAVVLFADVPDLVERLTWIVGVVAVGTAVGAYVLSVRREKFLPYLDALWGRLPDGIGQRILRLEHEFLDGVATIADTPTLVRTLALSFYIWFVIVVGFGLGFWATGIEVSFFGAGLTVTTIVALAVSIPSAPAFVGQFEWGCKLALEQIYAVDGARAVGYSILVHITQFLIQVAMGLVFLVREGLSLHDIGDLQAESRQEN